MKRTAALFGACALSLGLVLGAGTPAAYAEDKKPSREDFAAALDTAYRGSLMDMGAKDSDIDAFGDCIVKATYDKMSPAALTAIANDDMDYQLEDADANIFLESTQSCLEATGLGQLQAAEDNKDSQEGDTAADPAGKPDSSTESQAQGDGQGKAQDSTASGAATQEEMEKAAASAAESEAPAKTDKSASWRLPLAMGLFVLAILALSGYLVLTNRAKAARTRAGLKEAEDAKVSDILS